MKFEDYKYKRPNLNEIKKEYPLLLLKLKDAKDFETFEFVLSQIQKIRKDFETMSSLVNIRYKINTKDEFYGGERKIIDEISPTIQNLDRDFFAIIVHSKFKKDFIKKYGRNVMEKMELSLKVISPKVIGLLEEENKLASEYFKLIGSAELAFQGKKMNLSQIRFYFDSRNRDIRRKANEVYWKFFSDNEKKFDDIYDSLVKIRHEIATKLGYKNFIDLVYDRWGRNNFNKQDVEQLRENLFKTFIPLTKRIREWQRGNLKVAKLKYYDEPVFLNEQAVSQLAKV